MGSEKRAVLSPDSTQKLTIPENGQGPVQAQPQVQGRMGLPQSTRQSDTPCLKEGKYGERVLLPREISGNRLEMNVRGIGPHRHMSYGGR